MNLDQIGLACEATVLLRGCALKTIRQNLAVAENLFPLCGGFANNEATGCVLAFE